MENVYSQVSAAYKMMALDNGGSTGGLCVYAGDWPTCENCFKNEFLKYLKSDTSCDEKADETNDCLYSTNLKYLNGTDYGWGMNWYPGVILPSGAMLSLSWWGDDPPGECYQDGYYNYTQSNFKCYFGNILVDMNGAKSPNQIGKDVYEIVLSDNFIYPNGADGTEADLKRFSHHWGCDLIADNQARGWTCAADYFHGE